jgi:hypothetical protein
MRWKAAFARAASRCGAACAPQAAAHVAAQPIDSLKKGLAKCLEVFGRKVIDQFAEGEDAVGLITEMCRPEIEALARGSFLADNAIGLPKARDEALVFAIEMAAKLFTGRGT